MFGFVAQAYHQTMTSYKDRQETDKKIKMVGNTPIVKKYLYCGLMVDMGLISTFYF